MASGPSGIIPQGTDCWVEANGIIDVRTGSQMSVVGMSVYAVARARYERVVLGRQSTPYRYRMSNPVVATWSTTPGSTDGLAIAGTNIINGVQFIDQVQLHITGAQTEQWRCPLVAIQALMTDPVTGYEVRIIDEVFEVSFDSVND